MRRIGVLDLWRSVCVAVMVAYHAVYDAVLFGALPASTLENRPVRALAYATAGSFVLLSGIVSRWSRNGLRRGFRVFCLGLAVTAAASLVGVNIAFGVLSFMGVAMMGVALGRERLAKAAARRCFAPLCVALFALSAWLTHAVRVPVGWLYPLGLRTAGFSSADYFPLLPWGFLYLLGFWLGGLIERHRNAALLRRRFPSALTAPGRYSLWVYLLHQPLLYGLCWLLWR